MSENPFESPREASNARVHFGYDKAELRTIAKHQRVIITCIGVYLVWLVLRFSSLAEAKLVMGISLLCILLACAVFVSLLATRFHGAAAGVLMGILTLVPLVGLIILLTVNGKATKILKENGIAVGLFGADASKI